jgi:hypothetical protein
MTFVTNTWRQLVRSKLWPVAVLLLAALAAVPFLLAREAQAPEPLAPLPVASEAGDSIAEPVVAKVSTEDRDRRRRVLGVRKDPFRPAPVKKSKTEQEQAGSVPPPSGGGTDTGGGTVTGGGTPAPEKTYYEAGTIIVRFGEASESARLTQFPIAKMAAVPDETLPLLVYMGLTKDGKKAKFLVDASVEVDGDGDCKPHRSNCEVIELAVGETEFLDVRESEELDNEPAGEESAEETEEEEGEAAIVASFQLDLVDIKRAGDADVR